MAVSSYLSKAFDPNLRTTVAEAVKILKPHLKEFDAIAVRGTSGLIIGSILSYLLRKSLVVVRKPYAVESSHKVYDVECPIKNGSYLIVDDQIATGTTVKAMQKAINEYTTLKFSGYIYTYGCWTSTKGCYYELQSRYVVKK
jgi:adenine/guanine phosphoribosyltransferase-like PRPP-binding protein